MSKKSVSLGPSNDIIPSDEMSVAMIVQNAKARGLGWTSHQLYDHVPYEPGLTTKCCVIGAACLEKSTENINISIDGNDDSSYRVSSMGTDGGYDSQYMIGAGFRCAMQE